MMGKFKEDNLYVDSIDLKSRGGEDKKKEAYAFLLCWITNIWKRIWRCTYLYCDHNGIDISSKEFIKCMKYNLLSPTGILEKTKIYLDKALLDGFLMPQDYNDDSNKKFISKTVYLFTEAYKLAQIEDKYEKEAEVNKFIYKNTLEILKDHRLTRSENKDILRDAGFDFQRCDKNEKEAMIGNDNLSLYFNGVGIKNTPGGKHCIFCELVDSWDLDITLCPPQDEISEILRNAIMKYFQICIFDGFK